MVVYPGARKGHEKTWVGSRVLLSGGPQSYVYGMVFKSASYIAASALMGARHPIRVLDAADLRVCHTGEFLPLEPTYAPATPAIGNDETQERRAALHARCPAASTQGQHSMWATTSTAAPPKVLSRIVIPDGGHLWWVDTTLWPLGMSDLASYVFA